MSELGRAVAAKLKDYELDEVEEILREARISTAATVPKPVRLRVEQVDFQGIKRLRVSTQKHTATGTTDDAAASSDEEVQASADDADLSGGSAKAEAAPSGTVFREVPFDFSWKLGPGLYGVGSVQNLRGKSSLLEIIRWALRGRCRLQSDVALWLRHVTVKFLVNDEHIVVDFDVLDGVPRGSVTSQGSGSEPARAVAEFSDHDSFEQVMDAVMMPLLQLQRIASWQDDKAVEHAWVTYAGALTVSSRGLEQLMGDIAFSGLPSRLLSMFLGSAWTASRAQAATALRQVEAALENLEGRAAEQDEILQASRAAALERVERAKAALTALPAMGITLETVAAASTKAQLLSRNVVDVQLRVDVARGDLAEVRRQLKEERALRRAQLEDALARRFFHNLKLTACPRCSAPVTDERRARESSGHECSVCTEDLDLAAYEQNVVVAVAAPEEERSSALASVSVTDDDDEPTDTEEALLEAEKKAVALLRRLEGELTRLVAERDSEVVTARGRQDESDLLEQRRAAELELARAEGAAEALAPTPAQVSSGDKAALERQLKVFKKAESITTAWVRAAQEQPLKRLSEAVAEIARDFGVEQLDHVEIGGGANMTVHKGGSHSPYGRCVPTEQLRLKVATALALLRAGFDKGVGRHPGLLMVDSPGSEEANPQNLDTMIEALQRAVVDEPNVQVIIATTASSVLDKFIPRENRRVAAAGEYVW